MENILKRWKSVESVFTKLKQRLMLFLNVLKRRKNNDSVGLLGSSLLKLIDQKSRVLQALKKERIKKVIIFIDWLLFLPLKCSSVIEPVR